ncbi:MAG: polymer-forming cytoskeletal protein [Alphaproteobacteria bacterium]|nr:polymer-forming cytoskeletal protein [Alphaproteobacteria bacterium]
MANSEGQTLYRPEVPRRLTDIPSTGAAHASRYGAEAKTLIVGRDIDLSGSIGACERLVVEGRVEAALRGCHHLEIASGGVFKGVADVREARVNGSFEGTLTVRGCLQVEASGRVNGEVHYGEIEIARGGQVGGQVQALSAEEDDAANDVTKLVVGESR